MTDQEVQIYYTNKAITAENKSVLYAIPITVRPNMATGVQVVTPYTEPFPMFSFQSASTDIIIWISYIRGPIVELKATTIGKEEAQANIKLIVYDGTQSKKITPQ